MKLIVGLGNPGPKYQSVRHNLGFMAIEEYIKRTLADYQWLLDDNLKSEVIKYGDLLFAKPQTYMNNSGMAVKFATSYWRMAISDLIVIHDDLDLPLGKIKVRLGGAAAGHHGVESIIKALETDQFIRIRLGIGNLRSQSGEHKGQAFNAEHFVLEPFMPNEKSKVKHMIKQAVAALELLLAKGLTVAQNQYN